MKFEYIKLKEVVEIIQGQSPESKYYNNKEGFPFLQGSKTFAFKFPFIENYTKKTTKIAKKESILFSIRAPVGNINIAPFDICIGRGLASIVANNINTEYLYYYLLNIKEELIKLGSGTTFKEISKQTLEEFKIRIIKDLPTQTLISSILSTIDAKIELNNKINRELENLAKDIYDYYFIQFDFLDINNNNKPYKSSGGEMVYNEILKRYIPKGWEVKDIKELCDIKDGYAFKTDNYINNGKYKIITIKNVLDNYVDSNKCDTIDFIPNNIDKYSTLKEKDILISLTGEIGRISLVYENNLLLNQRVGNIIPKDNIYYSYILYLFKSVFIKDKLKQISNGSNQKNLSPIEAEKIKVLIPPRDILTNFSNLIKPKIDLIINNKKQNLQLSQLRDFLLPMLMNGQVEVEGEK